MKSIRMLSITVVAAFAVLALVGAGTASAAKTTLCKAAETQCANAWPAETEFTAKSAEVKITGSTEFTCESTAVFKADEQAGQPLQVKTTAVTWSNCKGANPVETTLLPSGTLTSTGGGNGTLALGKMEIEMHNVLGFTTCKGTAAKTSATVNGGKAGGASLTADNVQLALTGFACGSESLLNAGGAHGGKPYYIVSAKEPGKSTISNPAVFVENAIPVTTLCKSHEEPCATAWPAGTEFTAKSTSSVFSSSVEMACESSLTFKANSQSGNLLAGNVTALTWSNCAGAGPVTTTSLPTVAISSIGSGNGAFSTFGTVIELKNWLGFATCKYEMPEAALSLVGGKTGAADLTAKNIPVKVAGFGCGTNATWNASYDIVSGKEPGKEPVSSPSVFVEEAP